MNNILLLIVCFILGILIRQTRRLPDGTPVALNGYIIHIALPALTLLAIRRLQPDPTLIFAAAMPWVLFGLGALFFLGVGRLLRFDRATIGALILVGGLGNTSFVGLPMIEAYYGKELLPVGVIADQFGSFLVLSTLGIATAVRYSSGDLSWQQMARRVLLFPPFQAVIVGLLLRPVPYPDWLVSVLQRIGDTLTPLALFAVGFQLRLSNLRAVAKPLGLGIFYKLILGPALIVLLFVGLLGGRGPAMQVTIFEAAMASMISAGIIAVDHELNPPLVTLLIGLSIPLSFITLALWYRLLLGV